MTGVADAGFGVYVHWPYCAAICPYCAFNVVRDRGRSGEKDALVEALLADLDAWAERTGPRRLTSLYFGGGTPSRLDPAAVGRLVDRARDRWSAGADLEVSLEANPDDCDAGRLADLRVAGVTRLSIGVQSLDDAALAALGRWHGARDARLAVERALAAFDHVSLDLIYARPDQTLATWETELADALALGVEHVSLYELSVEPGTAFAKRAERGEIAEVDDGSAADFLAVNVEVCRDAGFGAYEVSNYARTPAARSAHNLVYWRSGEWVGAGPGAHGRLGALGGERVATETDKDLAAYVTRVRDAGWGAASIERLDREAQLSELLLMGLRLDEGAPTERIDALGGLDAARVATLVGQGLLAQRAGRLIATAVGRALIDRIALELLG